MRKTLLLLLSALAVGGCRLATHPEPPRPELSEQWLTPLGSSEELVSAWWKQLEDEQLNRLVERGLAHNYTVAAAQARLREAHQDVRAARAPLYPSLGLVFTALRQRGSQMGPGGTPGLAAAGLTTLTQNVFTLAWQAAWELDLFGEHRAALDAAKAQEALREAELEGTRQALVAEIVSSYLALQGDAAVLKEARKGIDALDKRLQLERQRQGTGLLTPGELSLSESQLRAAQALLPSIEQSVRTQQLRLATLVGQLPENFQLEQSRHQQEPETPKLGIRSELLRRRPDVQAAERALQAAWFLEESALASFFPDIVLSGAFGRESTDISTLWDEGNHIWQYGGELSHNFFAGGATGAAYNAANARSAEARAQYQQVILEAVEECERLLTSYVLLRESESIQSQAVRAAEKAFDNQERLEKSGLSSAQIALDAAYNLSLQVQQALELRTQRQLAWVALHRALAGSLEEKENSDGTTRR